MSKTKHVVKFKLPVGAIIGGCIHAGDGVFVSLPPWDVESKHGMLCAPTLFEGVINERAAYQGEFQFDVVPARLERFFDGKQKRFITLGRYVHEGKSKSEVELAQELGGLSALEYRNMLASS